MHKQFILSIGLALIFSGCASDPNSPRSVRASVEASLQRTVTATKAKDINAYMAELPGDLKIYDRNGRKVSREEQRKNILRDWSIVVKTTDLTHAVDKLEIKDGLATVWTSQRWERVMLRRDGKATDNIVTTQKHRETWRKVGDRWLGYDIEELGGELFINGVRQQR